MWSAWLLGCWSIYLYLWVEHGANTAAALGFLSPALSSGHTAFQASHCSLSPSAIGPPNHLLTCLALGLETSKIKKFFPPGTLNKPVALKCKLADSRINLASWMSKGFKAPSLKLVGPEMEMIYVYFEFKRIL